MQSQTLPQWTPDFGFASEHLGSFPQVENPVEETPPLSGFHSNSQQLSTHAQMYGGIITDSETGQQYHVRLNAPPEPQGNQSWHNAPRDHDWTAYNYNNPQFYFAKKEESPYQYYETQLPQYLADGSGLSTTRVELDSRAKYSQGPPRLTNSFPGIREDNGRIAGFHGFQDMTRYVKPTPITGKEYLQMNGRLIPHIGGQRLQGLPVEGRRTVPSGKLDVVNRQLPQQPAPSSHLNPLRERIERIENGTPTQEDQSIYSLGPIQTMQTVSTSSSNSSLNPSQYSLSRLQYDFETEQPVQLMFRGTSYVNGNVNNSTNPNSSSALNHPIQSLNLEMPDTGVRHAVGTTQHQFVSTQPGSAIQERAQMYKDGGIRTVAQPLSVTVAAPQADYETPVEMYKDGGIRTVAQPLSVTVAAPQATYETPLRMYKDGTVRAVAQPLNVPVAPTHADYETPLRLFKDGSVRTVAQPTGPQAQTGYGDRQKEWRKPGEIQYRTPHGRSEVRPTQGQHTYETTFPKAGMKMLGKSLALEQPRAVFTGQLKERNDPRQPNKLTYSWQTMHDSRPQELMNNVPQSGYYIRPKEDTWAVFSDTHQARTQYGLAPSGLP